MAKMIETKHQQQHYRQCQHRRHLTAAVHVLDFVVFLSGLSHLSQIHQHILLPLDITTFASIFPLAEMIQ